MSFIWRDPRSEPFVFRERSSKKTVSFEHMRQIEAVVFILQIFFATRGIVKRAINRIFHSFSWGIFSHVTLSDQSRASENI